MIIERARNLPGPFKTLFGTLVGLAVLFLVAPGSAFAAPLSSFQGETMSAPKTKSAVIRDARASGGRARALERTAAATKSVETPAFTRVSVRARGEQCKGAPRMGLYVDGRLVAERSVRSDSWREYSADFSAQKGVHRVRVYFRNDRKTGGCDRDLKVDRVSFTPAPTGASPAPATDAAPSYSPKPDCDRSLQTLVNNAASGSVLRVPGGCVYRESVDVNKPLKLEAGAGAEIRGSDVWTGWTRSGSYWVKGTLPGFPTGGYCKPGTERCKWPEQVFFDGRPLTQVASNPTSGQFAVDANRRVVLADDPAGHTVEVTTRRYWLAGGAAGVTVEGFTMKHAANAAQSGALRNNAQGNWTVRNNDLSYAHGYNLQLGAARGLLAVGNDVHHAGQLGIGGANADLEIRNNKIHHNNTEAFDPSWEAGGVKNARVTRLVVDGNEVYANDHTGLWCDEGCNNATYSNNRVHHNARTGIHFEISDNGAIFGNEIWENGWGTGGVGFGEAGVQVSSSRNVNVYDNVFAWNNDGVTVVNEDRKQGDGVQYDRVTGVTVRNNHFFARDYAGTSLRMSLSWVRAYPGGNIYDPAANNRGYGNAYYYPAAEGSAYRYKWDSSFKRLAEFNATPGAEGRYLSLAEKNQIASAREVPAAPER